MREADRCDERNESTMTVETHSQIVLDESSVNVLLKRVLGKRTPVKSFRARHEGDHLHLTVDFAGGMIPFSQLMGDSVEADLRLSVSEHVLRANLELHGVGALIQQAFHFSGIGSAFFFFAPHLRNHGPLTIRGLYDLDYDLSSVRVPDGEGGKMKLTDLIRFHSISVGNGRENMLKLVFSIV